MVTDQLAELVSSALDRAVADGVVRVDDAPAVDFERPKRREHGDWSTNVALIVGKGDTNPRVVAQALVERMAASDVVEKVDVAGPGFINFHLSREWLHDTIRRAADPAGDFGRVDRGAGARVNVEYVSANPTGPVNVVSGRHAAVGDAIANLLETTGYEVTKEFYANDTGRQVRLFAESVAVRYLQRFGVERQLPEDGYRGDYVIALAAEIADEVGDKLVHAPEDERIEAMRDVALPRMVERMRASLERFGTRFDVWFSERSLHDSGDVTAAISRLEKTGVVEERDGALWFRSSVFGDDKDRVLVRANGEPTYLASDVAYLLDKSGRGFEHLIYLWGSDHHGTVARLVAAAEALGFDRARVEVRLIQTVTLSRSGAAVKGSKRAGVIVALDELIDEVGVDAARYTFLTRSIDAPLEFDIELAKEQAPENPVYYVQYAHARISSILRRAQQDGKSADAARAPLSLLAHPSEDELMHKLASYEEVVLEAAELRAPQRIARYLEELASAFSAFYRDCRVVSEDEELSSARLALCVATKAVVARGLSLLGVTAPDRM